MPFIIAIIAGVIIFYFALPALSFKSVGFWIYFIVLLLLFEVSASMADIQGVNKPKYNAGVIAKAGGIVIALSVLIFIISSLASSRLFYSAKYANMLKNNIKEADFSTYEATLSNVPLLDKDSAIQISNRELGSLIDVVSQFELGKNEQITLKEKSVRVSPLYYGSFFKWNNNRKSGTPGYIKIDMMTQEAELFRLKDGIKYSPSEFFGRDLNRYLRMKYPSAIFTSFNFEINEDGEPFWIVPVEKHTIGLFGGVDVDYILTVNAVTGDIDKYSIGEVPEWIDNVYNSDMIISQYDDYGSFQNGYWNSKFGQKGVKVTTDGYNYIPQGDDNWIYTGVTSAGRDESNIGFILSNKRTDEYNRYMDFVYDKEYTRWRNYYICETDGYYPESYDLIVIDDIFPSDMSGFRYQEFTSYLQEIKNTRVLCTGQTIKGFLKQDPDEIIIEYKRRFPSFSGNVCRYDLWRHVPCKLMYFVFPTNGYNALPIIERNGIPFVFTLYPGGGFVLNNTESDERLKRLFDSPFFKKVIVTQQITYDYLINKKYCTSDKIEFIFGGVMLFVEYHKAKSYIKKRYGFDKKVLDICFVGQRYTEYGEDKGYDIFIEAAKILCKIHENIHFHVVGGFDEKVIDVSDMGNRITFHGKLNLADFDLFFEDKDIIISPNIDGKISKGAFDGFPTGSCVEAGLRKRAIFCTDPLNLNGNRLINGEEIIIIPHDAEKISESIESYYDNPDLLKKIGENGQEKLLYLYSYEYQIAPRIKLLRQEIEKREGLI